MGAIIHCGLEEDEDGWVFGVEAHKGAISDQFVGATEFSSHGKPGTRVEMMVDSGSTATVCGLEHFSDTPVTVGPPIRLRASNGQPLKHYGHKKVELLSDGGEKMHVTFSVHDVKRAIISTSATTPSGIETHLDEWNPQEGRTVSYFKKRTSGGTRWLNIMTRGGLYFLGATVASGQLQQQGAYPMSCGYEHNLTFPKWRTIGDVAPVDGEQDRVTFRTWRTSGDVAPVDGDEEMAPAEEAAGEAPVDVAADADPANDPDDPEADDGLNDGLAPTDPVAPPISVGRRQPNETTEAERLAHNRTLIPYADWCESCVLGRGRDDPHRRQDLEEGNPMPIDQCDYFFFKAEKDDILCKAIGAIDSVYNRTMALECEFKGLSDQAVPKQLREYLKSLGFERAQVQGDPEGALNNVLDRAIHGLPGWTRRQSPLKDKPAHGRVERFHATLEGLMRTWRNDVTKRYEVSLPAHHPIVAWLVRHCAWLHDRFVMKRQDQQTPFQRQMARDYPGVVIPIFETVLWREPGPHVMHIILTRQGALTARSVRRLAPSESTNQQLLLAAKGHPGRLKAMTEEPEVLPVPLVQSLAIRPPEPAAGPAPTAPAGGTVESEQSEERTKTDTQMDDVEEEREEPVPRKRGRPPTRQLPVPYSKDYTRHCGGCTGKTYYHIKACPHHQEQETRKFLRSLERGEQVQQPSSSSSAAVPGGAASSAAVPGGAASSTTSPGETVLQSPATVEVAPMTEVQPETPGEAETGEPPYKAARSGDIVMVIDGETLCVPEEDAPKVYNEEDDGQVLPTEQVHESMQRELQLMRDLEVSERVLRSDVPPGKKVWSTRWCHRRKGTGVRSDNSVTMIGRRLSLEFLDLWLCVFFCASAQSWSRV